MNLFELYDYIESLEVRIKILEKLVVEEKNKKPFNVKPPFYYGK